MDDEGELGQGLAVASLTLARRFAAGATLWCCAPARPHHGRHVVVEFVHPVIVGKRALPAAMVPGPDPMAALRALSKTGDVLLAVAGAEERPVLALMQRAPAWGLSTIWIGHGPRPKAGAADHVLWAEDDSEEPAADAALVLRYHLLWELTHVCFEHPGLLTDGPPAQEVDGSEGVEGRACITCSDEGRLAEVVMVAPSAEARVRTAKGAEAVDTTLVGPVGPGDLLLVHAGAAISVVDRAS